MDKSELIERCREHNVRFVRLQFTELYGQLKNVSIPRRGAREGAQQRADVRRLVDPRLQAHRAVGHVLPAGSRHVRDPALAPPRVGRRRAPDLRRRRPRRHAVRRRSARRAQAGRGARPRELGYEMSVGPEAEFFLFKRDANGAPTVDPHDKAAYFDVGAGGPRREHAARHRGHARTRWASTSRRRTTRSRSASTRSTSATPTRSRRPTTSITFRWVVRVIAAEHGMHATFMPKPIFGENGSGMHVNQSLAKGGENAFYDPNGELELSDTAYGYIAGLLEHVQGDHRDREPDGQLVQAARAGLRGARLHRLVAGQPLGRDPHPGQARPLDARRAAHAGPEREPVPGVRGRCSRPASTASSAA